MKKIGMMGSLLAVMVFMTACGPAIQQMGDNRYKVVADDVPSLGCSTAASRFEKASFGICPNGFDVAWKKQQDDGICKVFGEISCRAAGSSEIK